MTKHGATRSGSSLLERAAEVYDFASALRVAPVSVEQVRLAPEPESVTHRSPEQPPPHIVRPASNRPANVATVDRLTLAASGFLVPDAAVTGLAEEYRIIKRKLLIAAGGQTGIAEEKRRSLLVCSAQPDEGKTFSALNLALSLAGERDIEVLLVDGDFTKPEIFSILGIEGGRGFVDALVDPDADPEDFVIRTDIEGLSVLPAGLHANNVPELLASERTREVLAALTGRNPRRILIFDSPPALMASPASVLAAQVGQVLLVVRADKTTEADLRETVSLLSGCEHVSLMLNGAGLAATARRFGSYYGYPT